MQTPLTREYAYTTPACEYLMCLAYGHVFCSVAVRMNRAVSVPANMSASSLLLLLWGCTNHSACVESLLYWWQRYTFYVCFLLFLEIPHMWMQTYECMAIQPSIPSKLVKLEIHIT